MKLLLRWTASAMGIAIIAWLLPGVAIDSFWTAMIVAAVLALLNIFVKPILVFLTIPVTLLTLGLFILVINAVIILMASSLVHGFLVDSFWWALLFSLLNSLLNALINNSQY
ncbi:MAG: phage holin family protein [Bacteroidales bacterium]|jgi:putative membrane protein|nr:phage holin family protein [Bacteroidales bacterium]NPV36115.1 phage holin family protein [Bacteroidales bacterium]